ncbi:hypothetical protein CDO52_07705 [Nocardiopsis gilva YIM 90087]|uniref:Putative zinc-finger domain-containing protein n=2 Tax=Nocardiopsis gilva TaxID=280236 RepID=A0A223S3H2_9ACTN|nr:zf-HC2 domain-containing protein [Nocardiopsis gilva]ASU82686.1 hypothetical protein CDO52_07705 [Nocardiopsis gilva YIM 90087]
MDHLGERLSALVDGELGDAERDRALIHLASCESCRFEAEMMRRLKRRLHHLDEPAPSNDFMGRLSALSGPPSAEPPAGPPPGGGPGVLSRPRGSRSPFGTDPFGPPAPGSLGGLAAESAPAPTSTPAARALRRRRGPEPLSVLRPGWPGARYAVAGASVVALTLGTAFVAGGDAQPAPVVRPALEDYAVEHAVTARQGAFPTAPPPSSASASVETVIRTGAIDAPRPR